MLSLYHFHDSLKQPVVAKAVVRLFIFRGLVHLIYLVSLFPQAL